MALDITVYPHLSPRIIVIDYPQTEASIQELFNAIRAWEDSEVGSGYPYIIDAGGKEDLGGGVVVGITATLQNAKVRFAARPNPISSGTATAADSTGKVLTDSGADFVSDGVEVGNTVFNVTTLAMETIVDVDSGGQEVTTFPLQAGSRQDWQVGDSYYIYPNELCQISGGNLVAVDEVGATIDPVYAAPNINVIRASSSSSTLTDLEAIRYASYQNAVWVQPSASNTGTEYPIGTRQYPVNNLTDAMSIAESKGFSVLQILESITFGSGTNVSNLELVGFSRVKTEVIIESGATCVNTAITNCNLSGVLDGGTRICSSLVGDIQYLNGEIHDSGLYGTITLGGGEEASIISCYMVDQDSPPIIDMGGSGQDLAMPYYQGLVTITNLTSATEEIGIGLGAGAVTLDSSITAGTIIVSGNGVLYDNSTGTAVVNTDGLMSKQTITEITWDTVYVDIENGESGTDFPIGTAGNPSDNIADATTIAEDNSITRISIKGSIILPQAYTHVSFVGNSVVSEDIITLNGQDLNECSFKNVTLEGSAGSGSFDAINCKLSAVGNLLGNYLGCVLSGTNSLNTGFSHFKDCSNGTTTNTKLDFAKTGSNADITTWSGLLGLRNVTEVDQNVTVYCSSGYVAVESSCTNGAIGLGGLLAVSDNSGENCTVNLDAVIMAQQLQELRYKIEKLVPSGVSFGSVYYWDPYLGDDANDGTTESKAVETFSAAHALTEDGAGDLIIALDNTPSGPTVVTENIDISNDAVTLMGPGRQFRFATTAESPVVTISGNHCSLHGFMVSNTAPTNQTGVEIMGDYAQVSNVEAVNNTGSGIRVYSASYCEIRNCVSDSNNIGIRLNQNCINTKIIDVTATQNVISGISISNACDYTAIGGLTRLQENGGNGLFVGPGNQSVILGSDVFILNNVGDDISDELRNITRTWDRELSPLYNGSIHIDTNNGISGTNYPLGTRGDPVDNLVDARAIATSNNINKLCVTGSIELLNNYDGYTFESDNPSNATIDISGESVDGAVFKNVTLTRSPASGSFIRAEGCTITGGMFNVNGYFKDCIFGGTFSVLSSGSFMVLNGTALSITTIDLNGSGSCTIDSTLGTWVIREMTDVDSQIAMSGKYFLTLNSTNTAGTVLLSGVGAVTNNVGDSVIVTDKTVPYATWQEAMSDHTDPGTTGANQQHGVVSL